MSFHHPKDDKTTFWFLFLYAFGAITSCISYSPGSLPARNFGRLYGTFSENRLGICGMLKLDHFVCSGKDHFMLTYDITAANCGNTDLFRITLFSSAASVVSIMIGDTSILRNFGL